MRTCRLFVLAVAMVVLASACPAPLAGAEKDAGDRKEITDWQVRWELARTLSYARKLDESVAEYEKLLKEKPDLEQAKAEMATVMFWKGKKDEALKVFEKIPAASLTQEAKTAMAELYAANGNYETAEKLYRERIRTNPKDDDTRLKLAEVLSWAKKYKDAVVEYELLLKTRPDDKQIRRKYALVLSWMGEHEKAAVELRKTLDDGSAK
jgi:tetratricopeptide (TPR) repeat protein